MTLQTRYDAIYLSPHLDDAALSCGGQIFDRTVVGQHVLIVTIMAGSPRLDIRSPYIESLHARWKLDGDVVAQRRAEDLAACRILGADALHLGLPDCIYRTDPATGAPLYQFDAEIFGEVNPGEVQLVAALAEQLRALPACSAVYAPLTAGHHVDHQLVRAAAEEACPTRLVYYEDFPYAQQPGQVETAQGAHIKWTSTTVPITARGQQAKFAAIWTFRSQMSTFFADRSDMERQVGSYLANIGGERWWRKA